MMFLDFSLLPTPIWDNESFYRVSDSDNPFVGIEVLDGTGAGNH